MLLGGAGGNPKPEGNQNALDGVLQRGTDIFYRGESLCVCVCVCLENVTAHMQSGAAWQAANAVPTLLLCKWC